MLKVLKLFSFTFADCMRDYCAVLLVGFTITVALFSCKENTKEDLQNIMGYEYYPLEVGKCRTYQIDSISYNSFNQSIDTFKSVIKECLVGEFLDSTNTPYFRIEYLIPDMGWNDPGNRKAAAVQLRNNIIVHYTDSGKIAKLAFPLKNNRRWDMNMFNSDDELLGRVENFGLPFSTALIQSNQSLTVRYKDFKSPIAEFTFYEVFAKDTGLIYSEDANIIRVDGKVSGNKVIHSLISYE